MLHLVCSVSILVKKYDINEFIVARHASKQYIFIEHKRLHSKVATMKKTHRMHQIMALDLRHEVLLMIHGCKTII